MAKQDTPLSKSFYRALNKRHKALSEENQAAPAGLGMSDEAVIKQVRAEAEDALEHGLLTLENKWLSYPASL